MAAENRDNRMVYIGAKLRAMRETYHYTQEDMADKINVSPSAVCRFESATRLLTVDILLEYAKAFDLPVSKLLPNEYVKEVEQGFPQAYYELNVENQKVVQNTLNVLINSLLLQQKKEYR